MSDLKWGIDLGGTKIEGVLLKIKEGKPDILFRKRIATESQHGYDYIIQRIGSLINDLKNESGETPAHIGIGTPGSYDPLTLIHKNSNTTCLNGRTFKADLERYLNVPLSMANDANCFAVAEATLGAVPDKLPSAKVIFGIIMGTGVGGGVVVDGKVIHGRHGIGGEFGHIKTEENDILCYCGHTGCNENVMSGPALEKYFSKISGHSKSMKEIVSLWREGETFALATRDRMLSNFGLAASYIVNLLDPDAIVIGGGLGQIDELYEYGQSEILKHMFNTTCETPLLKPLLGDSAGVIGAA
ncbi:MAG: ROK family protein, partial [Saprospiraceae bacterium]